MYGCSPGPRNQKLGYNVENLNHFFFSEMDNDLISSAVSFLKDPNVASSPLSKKIEFLQSKGLNEQQIEEALKRANDSSSGSSASASPQVASLLYSPQQNYVAQPPLDYYSASPQVPERNWKDYFIMATATAGVTYGLYQVVTRFLIPSIMPPGQSRVDQDKEKIDEEFVKIDKVLEQMALEQKEIKDTNEAKLKEIDVVIDNVNDFLAKYNKDKLKFDDDLRLMKLEVDNLLNAVEKNMRLTKESISDELRDISDELLSLRNLIKARGDAASSSERKVAPVSSIPSASEILKRAKSQAVDKNNSTGEPSAEANGKASTPAPATDPSRISSPSGEVFAAGIPDWQLKHKQAEEEREALKAQQEKTPETATEWPPTQIQSGIPLWQQLANKEDKVVEDSIKNVGVPAWQLNAAR